MFVTSKGTMDKASPEVRKYLAQRAELLAAVRLPDNTFPGERRDGRSRATSLFYRSVTES